MLLKLFEFVVSVCSTTDFLRGALLFPQIRPLCQACAPRFLAGVARLFLWLAQSDAGLEVWQGRWQDLQNTIQDTTQKEVLSSSTIVVTSPALARNLSDSFSHTLSLSLSLPATNFTYIINYVILICNGDHNY